MSPFQVITLSSSEMMRNKRNVILGYYHESKESLDALRILVDREIITSDQGYDYARPILDKYANYREWLDRYTLDLLTPMQELKDECDLNSFETMLGSAE